MRTPAAPGGAEIENQTKTERSSSTSRHGAGARTSNVHVDCPPNWRRLGTIIDDMIAGLTPEST